MAADNQARSRDIHRLDSGRPGSPSSSLLNSQADISPIGPCSACESLCAGALARLGETPPQSTPPTTFAADFREKEGLASRDESGGTLCAQPVSQARLSAINSRPIAPPWSTSLRAYREHGKVTAAENIRSKGVAERVPAAVVWRTHRSNLRTRGG